MPKERGRVVIGVRIDGSAVAQQLLHHGRVALLARNVKQEAAVIHSSAHARAAVEHQASDLEVAFLARNEERREAMLTARLQRHAAVQQQARDGRPAP